MSLLLRYLTQSLTLLCLLGVQQSLHAQEIFRERSLYRDILVYEEDGLRCMKFGIHDHGRQSCVSLKNPDVLVFSYTRMLLGALYLNPNPKRILVIGLGGGTMPTTLKKILPESEITCVELDPAVAKVAAQFFGFKSQRDVVVNIDDGRVFVKRNQKTPIKYDLVILDAFDHLYIPEHMLTREFLTEVKHLLADEGVLAANTFSGSKLYDSESATYFDVFGAFYNLQSSNRVILARKNGLPPSAEIDSNAAKIDQQLKLFGTGKEGLLPLFKTNTKWPAATRILTDKYSPANLLNSRG